MKHFSMLILVAQLLAFSLPAHAEGLQALVIDRDVKGANVRNGPSGRVINVIPFAPPDATDELLERRVVTIVGQEGKWFLVEYDGDKKGWMHGSVLGFCAASTEDGKAKLKAAPHSLLKAGRVVASVPDEARLVLTGVGNGTRLGQGGICGSPRQANLRLVVAAESVRQSLQCMLEITGPVRCLAENSRMLGASSRT